MFHLLNVVDNYDQQSGINFLFWIHVEEVFFAKKFLFSEGACYILLIQITILSHPNLT